jgi:DNA-binding GntR family transcriptional regulator
MLDEATGTAQRLGDIAYQRLKAAILTCTLPPGCQVTEGGLAERIGLGKAPVRAALLRLGQERLVTTLPRRGYVVAPVTIRDVEEMFAMRRLLEPAAARLAAGRVDAARLRRLDAVYCATYTPGERGSEQRFLRANSEFHVAIAEATGNRRLVNAIAGLLGEIERLLHVGMTTSDRSTEIQQEHRDLVVALEAGDAMRAEALMTEQVNAAHAMVSAALMANNSLRDVSLEIVRLD